jgi:hypothetical protein
MKMEATNERAMLNAGNLSATTIKVRDAVIQKCEGKNLHEMTQFIKGLLDHEENDQKRLGVLAARVYLLREKIMIMKTDDESDSAEDIKNRHSDEMEAQKAAKEADIVEADTEISDNPSSENKGWMRVQIIENAEVNNVRFPAGVVIDAVIADAQRLIDSGKAEAVIGDDDDNGDNDNDGDDSAQAPDNADGDDES